MGTLNQYAARIANMVNQPNNHELKERVKDMIKTMFANRIRQSVEKNGIDDILKLTFIAPVEELKYSDILPTEYRVANKIRLLGTKYKVPTPVRIQSDAPFAFVGDTGRPTCSPTGYPRAYIILNGHIIIAEKVGTKDIDDRRPINEVMITGIFENPDEVLSFFKNEDGQDIELPLPNDMLESIIQEILKTEFGIYPQDLDIKTNNNNPTIAQRGNGQD